MRATHVHRLKQGWQAVAREYLAVGEHELASAVMICLLQLEQVQRGERALPPAPEYVQTRLRELLPQ